MYKRQDIESNINTQLDRRTVPTLRTKRLIEHILSGFLVDNVCKYCLSECGGCLVDLQVTFQITTWRGDIRVSLADMIREVAPFKSDDETLPERMCEVCIDRLLPSYMFITRCREANEALQNCLQDIYDKTEEAQYLDPYMLPVKHENVLSYASFVSERSENIQPHPRSKLKSTLSKDTKNYKVKEGKYMIKIESDTQYNCGECTYTGDCWRAYMEHMRGHERRRVLQCAVEGAGADSACAVCLRGNQLVSVYEVVHFGVKSVTLKAMLDALMGSRRNEDLLSQLICEKCISHTIASFTFITKYRDMVRNLSAVIHHLLVAAFRVDDDHDLSSERTIQGLVLGTEEADSEKGFRLIPKNEEKFEDSSLQNKNVDANLNTVFIVKEPDDEELKEEGPEQVEYLEEFDSSNSGDPSYEPVVECSSPVRSKKRKKVEESSETIVIEEILQIYECSMCAEDFDNRASFKLHRNRHPPGTTHICRICKKIFATLNDFGIHRRTHLPVERNVMCSVCGKRFESDYFLRKHMVCHNERTVACDKCEAKFKTALQLRQHDRRRHQEQRVAAVCDVCGRACTSVESLAAHRRCHETRQCPVCRKTLKAHVHFDRHLRRHLTGERTRAPAARRTTYPCERCERRFTSKVALAGHVNKVHLRTRPFVCDICGKGFYAQCNLREHAVVHTGARREQCETCGARFVCRKTLVQHVRLHSGERPYPCALCPERFVSASRRATHAARVHERRAHSCALCSKAFWRRSTLTAHVRHVHERRRREPPPLPEMQNDATPPLNDTMMPQE